jgi:hypothetical protein
VRGEKTATVAAERDTIKRKPLIEITEFNESAKEEIYKDLNLLFNQSYLIFLDAINPTVNGGMKDAELSVFFNELPHLFKSTGSVGKFFSYMDKDITTPESSKNMICYIY